MTDFYSEVKKIEKQIKINGYDEKAEKNFLKRWQKINSKSKA
jgi:hypothetical protein